MHAVLGKQRRSPMARAQRAAVLHRQVGVAPHPGDDRVVALLDVAHMRAHRHHHAGALVSEHHRQRLVQRPVQLVQLGVAYAAGDELDRNVVGSDIGQFHLVDDKWLVIGGQYRGSGLHGKATLSCPGCGDKQDKHAAAVQRVGASTAGPRSAGSRG